MNTSKLRWLNTRKLIKQNSITPAEFARQLKKDPQQVNAFAGPNPSRNIGPRIARQIESCFRLPEGWLDKDHESKPGYSEPDSSIDAFRQAELLAERFAEAQRDWLKGRAYAIRKIEDDFADTLLSNGFNIIELKSVFDYRASSVDNPSISINLFAPMPGFSGWLFPLIESEQPDILAVAFLGESQIEYAIIPKEEYLKWARSGAKRAAFNSNNRTANQNKLDSFIGRFDLI